MVENALPLYVPIRILCCWWKGDTQEIEGVNNLIQLVCQRAPWVSLGLLDARVALRKELGLGQRSAKESKWSQTQPKANEMMRKALASFDSAGSIVRVVDRFKAPLSNVVCSPGPGRHQWCQALAGMS